MARFARDTAVSPDRSRAEIERTLMRYGATGFQYGWDDQGEQLKAVISFRMADRIVKFVLIMPSRSDSQFHKTDRGRRRKPESAHREWEQAIRQRWRAMSLVVKAKLEAVECGIATFEQEFMAHIVLPDGRTVGDFMIPQIEQAYVSGQMPKLLPWSK